MTTSEPGASDVFTHGGTVRPRATAFLASNPAAIITDGFDVLVHDVIAAITTWPSASSKARPSASVTGQCLRSSSSGRAAAALAPDGGRSDAPALGGGAGGSLAGNDSIDASSALARVVPIGGGASVAPSSRRNASSACSKPACAPDSDTRSCGRAGPASDGSTVERSNTIDSS